MVFGVSIRLLTVSRSAPQTWGSTLPGNVFYLNLVKIHYQKHMYFQQTNQFHSFTVHTKKGKT